MNLRKYLHTLKSHSLTNHLQESGIEYLNWFFFKNIKKPYCSKVFLFCCNANPAVLRPPCFKAFAKVLKTPKCAIKRWVVGNFCEIMIVQSRKKHVDH